MESRSRSNTAAGSGLLFHAAFKVRWPFRAGTFNSLLQVSSPGWTTHAHERLLSGPSKTTHARIHIQEGLRKGVGSDIKCSFILQVYKPQTIFNIVNNPFYPEMQLRKLRAYFRRWACSDTLGYSIYLIHMYKYQLQHRSHDNISGQNHLYTICSVIADHSGHKWTHDIWGLLCCYIILFL